jgi:predicted Zn-dependent protease with MMP-like domain
MDSKSFEYYIARALESIPPMFLRHLDNVEILWEEKPPRELLDRTGATTLLGLYEGIPLAERSQGYSMVLPDRITLFKKPIESIARGEREIIEEIRRTVIHEIGHHFGLSEEEISQAMGHE